MAEGTSEVARAIAQLTTALIEAMTRLSIALIERRAQRMREAAKRGEQNARQERARLARHRAADAAIWQRTANPVWWHKATPEQIAQAWRAVSTWHQVDADAAGTRQAMAERLRRRGVEVAEDVSANPGDAQWLRTSLYLAQAEREEQIAFSADLDTDAELAGELLWHADEQPRGPQPEPARGQRRAAREPGKAAEAGGEIVWDRDELPRQPATGQDRSRVNGGKPLAATAAAAETVTVAAEISQLQRQQPESSPRSEKAAQAAVATEPNLPYQLPAEQLDRMHSMLRQAWGTEPARADRVLADGAWPTLAASMHRLDAAGKDVPGLLRGLNAETTESSIPAVTTAWALRTLAAGPAARQRVLDSREAHRTRLELVRSRAPQQQVMAEAGDTAERQAGDTDDTTAARLLAQAFPESTRDALNRQRAATATGGQVPAVPRDRSRSTQRELAGQHER